MQDATHFSTMLKVLIASSFLTITAAFGQFTILSTSPANGSVGVDTAGTISVSFSAPLDTSARFSYPGDFFLNLMMIPDSLMGEPDSITLSPDMTTVNVHNLHLAANTTYQFIFVNAVSQSGDSLDSHYSTLFTTGASLPTATVSGTLGYPGNDPSGAWVVLFPENPFAADDSDPANGTIVGGVSGDFQIDYVAVGTYWPVALKNFWIDEEGDIEFQDGSAIGYYNTGGDAVPDSVVVPSGGQLTGIDFNMVTMVPQTARGPFPAVEALAQSWAPDARFVRLGGDPQPDGRGAFWQYLYYSPASGEVSGWFALGSLLAQITVTDSIADTLALPANWMDSDSALAIAENSGGFDFRQQNPHAEMDVFLGRLGFNGHPERTSPGTVSGSIRATRLFGSPSLTDTPIPQPAVWFVNYYADSTQNWLQVIMDAQTGEILNSPGTAAIAEQAARPAAAAWAADARLWAVGSSGSPVDTSGIADFWNCVYYSSILDSVHGITVNGQIPVYSGPQGWHFPDTATVPDGWRDTPAAMAAAEAAGGSAYRATNQDVFVEAFLSSWIYYPRPGTPAWRIEYQSSTTAPLEIFVDAFDGTVLGIDGSPAGELANQFQLYQNYPNPFNPSTRITFRISSAEYVTLKIFDILGREVTTLLSEKLAAGRYEYAWEAKNLASGVYFYQLSAGTRFLETRRMLLLR